MRDGSPDRKSDRPATSKLAERFSSGGRAAVSRRGREAADELEIRHLDAELERRVAERTAELEAANRANRRLLAAVLTVTDVTERDRRERVQREFVSNAAHELQTPLTAITSAVEVLQSGAKDVAEQRDRFLEHIEREAARLRRLTRALLTLARAQALDESPRAEVFDVSAVLREIADTVQTASGIEVQVRAPGRLAAHASRELTEQAVAQLVTNAARYTENGTIAVAACRHGERSVAVEVSDTGPGIPDDQRERIFERFYRGGSHDEQGFGLGLAIVDQIVSVLGAKIGIDSRPGGGTTVRLTLPAARE